MIPLAGALASYPLSKRLAVGVGAYTAAGIQAFSRISRSALIVGRRVAVGMTGR